MPRIHLVSFAMSWKLCIHVISQFFYDLNLWRETNWPIAPSFRESMDGCKWHVELCTPLDMTRSSKAKLPTPTSITRRHHIASNGDQLLNLMKWKLLEWYANNGWELQLNVPFSMYHCRISSLQGESLLGVGDDRYVIIFEPIYIYD